MQEVEICDVCNEHIATQNCDICEKSICKSHAKRKHISLGKGYLAKITLCTQCLKHIEYSNNIKQNEILKNILVEFIKKQMVIDELREENNEEK